MMPLMVERPLDFGTGRAILAIGIESCSGADNRATGKVSRALTLF